MRILKVSQFYYPAVSFGGLVSTVTGIAEGLARRGHAVVVVTSNLLDLHHKVGSQTTTRQVNGVTAVYLRTLLQSRVTTVSPGIIPFLARHVREFDVIHVYGCYDLLAPFVCCFARWYRIPYVFEPSGMLVPMLRSFNRKKIYHWILGKGIVEGASRIVATSEFEAESLTQVGIDEARIVVRHIGVDLAPYTQPLSRGQLRRRLGIAGNERIVLFLGRICPIKCLDLLLLAFSELPLPNTRLVIAGPDEGDGYLEDLKKMRSELALTERVIFTGPLFGQEKVDALTDADVFVLPSEYENFGIVAAEAVAAGTPVVVTDRCGIASHLRDRVGLVVAHDRNAIRNGMKRLLTDKRLHDVFRANCRVVAKEFSWDEAVARMEDLYSELLKSKE